jgi:RNA polymerase sigma-70 factor, ECF subfamily
MSEALDRKVAAAPDGPSPEMRALVARAAAGDLAAFRRIYDLHLEGVSRAVSRLLGPGAEVDDVVQEVFIRVHRCLADFRYECQLSTWLYRVARSVAISHLRRRTEPVCLTDWRNLRASASDFSRLEARERMRALHAALEQVAPESREAFLLFEIEGMKLREIAELTGEPLNTVAARVRRTREHLRGILDEIEEGEGDA